MFHKANEYLQSFVYVADLLTHQRSFPGLHCPSPQVLCRSKPMLPPPVSHLNPTSQPATLSDAEWNNSTLMIRLLDPKPHSSLGTQPQVSKGFFQACFWLSFGPPSRVFATHDIYKTSCLSVFFLGFYIEGETLVGIEYVPAYLQVSSVTIELLG